MCNHRHSITNKSPCVCSGLTWVCPKMIGEGRIRIRSAQKRGPLMEIVSRVRILAPFALAFSLAACGGGGIAMLPPPPQTPTPTPTPTPSAAPAGTFSWDFGVPVAGARLGMTANLVTGATSASILEVGQGVIRVQDNGGEYAIWSGHSKWGYDFPIFTKNTLGAKPTSGDETNNFAYYRFDSDEGSQSEELQLLKKGPTNSRIQLNYLTYGLYSGGSGPQTARQLNIGVFVMGQETAAANMPRTGSGSYSGIVDGYASMGGTGYRLLGSTGTLSANFASGAIATTLSLQGNSDFLTGTLGSVRNFGTLTGAGTIAGGTSTYSGTLSGFGMSGQFAGGFFGPVANETGYGFSAVGGPDTIAGVFVGKQ
jgi:hypothetical protein